MTSHPGELVSKVAVGTGATSGIGRAAPRRLAEHAADVVGCGLPPNRQFTVRPGDLVWQRVRGPSTTCGWATSSVTSAPFWYSSPATPNAGAPWPAAATTHSPRN